MSPMAVFFGEMQHLDHPTSMPAVVTIEKGTIRLASGKTQLGEWKLYQVVIRERDADSVTFRADDEELILKLKEHQSFLAETAAYRRNENRAARQPTHEAFRKEPEGPTLGEEIRDDVTREVSSVADEVKELLGMVKVGPPLWIALAVFILGVVFLPSLIIGLVFLVGVIALAVGAIAHADSSIALRLPGDLTATRLVAVGVILIAVGIVLFVIR
jgi:hypothetical protein